jgi:small acid-soluble spore protein H (minor)
MTRVFKIICFNPEIIIKKEWIFMDSKRAQEIMESHGVIEVLYKDSPVWIEQIKNDGHAEVTFLESNERTDVPVEQLFEYSM